MGRFLPLTPFLVLLAGCNASPFPNASFTGQGTYTAVRTQILEPVCLRCHNSGDPSGGVSFSTYDDTLASAGTVVPYQPHQSQLFAQCYSGEMPEDGNKLTDAQLQLLYEWIALGAHNN